MTLYEFNDNDLNERAAIVWDKGVSLGDRIEGDYNLILYKIDDFYAEVYYNNKKNEIDAIRSFKSDDPLQPYLSNIELQTLLAPDIIQYQTALYNAVKINEEIGWDYAGVIFESTIQSDPSEAMTEFRKQILSDIPWFATMRVITNGEITEEEIFDSSVVKIE